MLAISNPSDVEEFLEAGADVNRASPSGETPLMMAAGYGYSDITKMLLTHGADPALRDCHGETGSRLRDGGRERHRSLHILLLSERHGGVAGESRRAGRRDIGPVGENQALQLGKREAPWSAAALPPLSKRSLSYGSQSAASLRVHRAKTRTACALYTFNTILPKCSLASIARCASAARSRGRTIDHGMDAAGFEVGAEAVEERGDDCGFLLDGARAQRRADELRAFHEQHADIDLGRACPPIEPMTTMRPSRASVSRSRCR